MPCRLACRLTSTEAPSSLMTRACVSLTRNQPGHFYLFSSFFFKLKFLVCIRSLTVEFPCVNPAPLPLPMTAPSDPFHLVPLFILGCPLLLAYHMPALKPILLRCPASQLTVPTHGTGTHTCNFTSRLCRGENMWSFIFLCQADFF